MHSRLEQYVEQVEARLTELPPAQRESETEEMRQHISAMVEARMASGLCEEKAITDTLEQFGRAQTVSRQLTQVHDRNHKFLPDNLLTATLCTVVCTYGGAVLLCLFVFFLYHHGIELFSMKGSFYPARAVLVISIVLSSCLTAGGLTGTLFPRRAIAATGLIYLIYCAEGLHNISRYTSLPPLEIMQVCGAWSVPAAFTMAGAKMGTMWRRRRLHRKRLAA